MHSGKSAKIDEARRCAMVRRLRIRNCSVAILVALFGSIGLVLSEDAVPPTRLPVVEVWGTNSPPENLVQSAPQAISSLSGMTLEQSGRVSLLDLSRVVPGFSQNHAGLRSFSDNYVLRGIGNTEFISDPAVVVYLDDAPSGDALSVTTDLLDVERVEVYRGPQGSRFGKNAAAGVINITTRQPADRFEGEVRAGASSFNTQQYQVSARGPLATDTLSFALAGQFTRSDGYIRNTFLNTHADEREGLNGRATLGWQVNENWKLDFAATADRFRDGVGLVSLAGPPRQTQSSFDGKVDELLHSQVLRIHGEWAGLKLTSITARRDFTLDPLKFDSDFSPLAGNTGVVQTTQVQWSEEVRVQPSVVDGNWDWHAGFFFATSENDVHRPNDFFIPPLPVTGRDTITSSQTSDNYALFGEGTYFRNEKIEVTLGLRLDYSVRKMSRVRIATFAAPPPSRGEADFFNTAPKLTLGYHVTDECLVYGSTGLGFKPGGFSTYIDPPASPRFDTETVWANELGVKSTWLDRKLTANLAIFYNHITDYQVEQFAPASFDFTIANAPQARTMGAELEITARPVEGWEFSGFVGYTDARLDRFTDPFTGVTVYDIRPPFVAKYNAGVAAQYQHRRGWFGRVAWNVIGDTCYDAANTAGFRQSSYDLLSARIGLERKHWSVYLFGENLADAEYYTKKIPPLNAGAPGRPRTFGVIGTLKF